MGWGIRDLIEDRESIVKAGREDAGGKNKLAKEEIEAVEPGT